MQYHPSASVWGQVFPVPTAIVDKHIKLCGSAALKVLLIILSSNGSCCDTASLSERLGLDKSDISDSLNYWVAAGVLESDNSVAKPFSPVVAVEPGESPSPTVTPVTPVTPVTAAPAHTSSSHPRYTRQEAVALINADKLLHSLVQEAQQIFGKPLTSADLDVLTALYSLHALSPHYIVTLLHYCADMGKKGMAYCETVAVTWQQEGIDDSAVDAYVDTLMHRRSIEGRVKSALGLERSLISKEKQYIARWCEELGFGIEMITAAYEIAAERTGKIAFGYMDKVLSNWHTQGFTTPQQAKNELKPQAKPAEKSSELEELFIQKMMKGATL